MLSSSVRMMVSFVFLKSMSMALERQFFTALLFLANNFSIARSRCRKRLDSVKKTCFSQATYPAWEGVEVRNNRFITITLTVFWGRQVNVWVQLFNVGVLLIAAVFASVAVGTYLWFKFLRHAA